MKRLIQRYLPVLFIQTGLISSSVAESLRPPDSIAENVGVFSSQIKVLQTQNLSLKKAKQLLLNGEINAAQSILNQLSYHKTKLTPIVLRYLSQIEFIKGHFDKSLEHISSSEFDAPETFKRVCFIKVLSMVALDRTETLEKNWQKCKTLTSSDLDEDNLLWPETIINLKLAPNEGSTQIPFRKFKLETLDLNQTKIFLKLALFLNQEKLLLSKIQDLRSDQVEDSEIRELVGAIYFRQGQLRNSFKFIEDLKNPNSENIKGNLYLMQRKYDIAYSQFKVALDQKKNSQNALERLVPLAWKLGDWENGLLYTKMIPSNKATDDKKILLLSALYQQQGNFESSEKMLDQYFQFHELSSLPVEFNQMASFNALMLNQNNELKKRSLQTCLQMDIIHCWISHQTTQWDHFPRVIRREDKLPHSNSWKDLISSKINDPLKEKVYVNQLDIEELDDSLIKLSSQEIKQK